MQELDVRTAAALVRPAGCTAGWRGRRLGSLFVVPKAGSGDPLFLPEAGSAFAIGAA